jgi:hypothetical protein
MRLGTRVAPSHSLLLVMDESTGVIPDTMGGGLVAATPSCVAVGTMSEHDGETTVSISDGSDPVSGVGVLVFDGNVSSPNYHVAVCTVHGVVLLRLDTVGPVARVRIWVNDGIEPDLVEIVVTPS